MNQDALLEIFTVVVMLMTIGFSLAVVIAKSPVFGAVNLIFALLTTAVLFVLMSATFLAAAQVLIYAGGILVLFIFILMLLGVKNSEWHSYKKVGIAFLFVTFIIAALLPLSWLFKSDLVAAPLTSGFGTIHKFGEFVMSQYAYAFEMVSLILVSVIVGVVYLTKRKSG